MPLEPGNLLGERWRIVGPAPAPQSLTRLRVVALDSAEAAEAISPANGPPERKLSFERAFRALLAHVDPAAAAVRDVLVIDGRPWVIRAPLDDRSLADVRGPVPAEVAAWVGARLAPALQSLGGAGGTLVTDEDFALDPQGAPMFAPTGRLPGRVEIGTGRGVAPEVFAGAPPDGRSALYALGALLFRLTTGSPIPPAGSGRPPARASALRPDLPPDLDQAIAALLSSDPTHRPAGAAALGNLAGPPIDLRAWARPPALATALQLPSSPAATARLPFHLVVEIADLPRWQWNGIADRAGLPVSALARLVDVSLPLVVGRFSTRSGAEEAAATWNGASVRQTGPVGLGGLLLAGALGLAALFPLLAGAALLPYLYLVGWLFLLLGGAMATAGLGLGIGARRAAAAQNRALRGATFLALEFDSTTASGPLGRTWDRLRRARASLEALALPAAAEVDLRSSLRDAERRLEGLAEVIVRAEATTREVDPTRLRTRGAERALADYHAVERARLDAVAEVEELSDAVDSLLASAARIATLGIVDGQEAPSASRAVTPQGRGVRTPTEP